MSAVAVILAAGVLALLAVAMGHVLGWANRRFHVAVDPKVEALLAVLPGANCGGCGFVGCAEYAEAVARGEAEVSLCAPGGAAAAMELADIMGVEVAESLPYRAVVHCSAHTDQRLQRAAYRGAPTCAAVNLVAGVQGCTYGCLGFGDCERACNYDAIRVTDGLSNVNYDRCVGCGACARVCPRNIITLAPFKSDRMLVVACSNHDTAADVRAVCMVGCLGCRACTRIAPELISVDGALPEINYDVYDPSDQALVKVLEKCPRKRLTFVGKPTEKDLAAVADKELPEEIQADFKTTVDDTEWWG
ncbi:MAG: RnfABCDGE type electron transport complex subunit B [Armatimonadota bacterium]|nr:MAG: RnfABCDGE type electron transport complex subunit B [Armatimonadota bacterium]